MMQKCKYSTIVWLGNLVLLGAMPALMGCGDDAGSVQVFVEAEASITGGLAAGMGEEDIADGWSVMYDEFLVTVGNVRAARTDTMAALGDASAFVMDLKQHAGRQPGRGQRVLHADHRAADDVGGGTLDRRVYGGALVE